MAKIAIFSIPAFGHLNPQIHLARKLTERRHQVALYYHPSMQKYLGDEGFELVKYPNFDTSFIKSTDYILASNYLISGTQAVTAETLSFQPEIIFADGLAAWVEPISEQTGAKLIYTTPLVQFHFTHLLKHPWQLWDAIISGVKHPLLLIKYNAILRSSTGGKRSMFNIASEVPEPSLVFLPSYLQPGNIDKIFVGESFSPSSAELGAAFRKSFAKQPGKSLIYISLGTHFVNDELLRQVVSEISQLESAQIVVSSPNLRGEEFSSNVEIYPFVDQEILIPQCDLVVFNGGTNTTRDCIKNGVPQLIVPIGIDQLVQAESVERLKVGAATHRNNLSELKQKAIELISRKSEIKANAAKLVSQTSAETLDSALVKLADSYGIKL